ncbi:MAG: hypothetical protein IKR97_06370, partial [Eubacterium sp.]|nr:hypothetical protein [Eubacterium sp.]
MENFGSLRSDYNRVRAEPSQNSQFSTFNSKFFRLKGENTMDTVESLGYLKGLIDGLDIDENSKE